MGCYPYSPKPKAYVLSMTLQYCKWFPKCLNCSSFFLYIQNIWQEENNKPLGDGKLCSSTWTSSLKIFSAKAPKSMEQDLQKALFTWYGSASLKCKRRSWQSASNGRFISHSVVSSIRANADRCISVSDMSVTQVHM